MTNTLAFRGNPVSNLHLSPHDLRRGLAAGALWSGAMTGGMVVWQALNCGFIDPSQTLETAGLALAAGLLVFGPLAAFGGRASRS